MKWCFGLMLVVVTAQAGEVWQAPAFIHQAFIQVVLKSEYGPQRAQVKKWQQPIQVWVEDHTADQAQHVSLVNMQLAHLSTLTGLPMRVVSNRAQANVEWVFSLEARWHADVARVSGHARMKPPADAACMFGLQADRQGHIQHAWVVIPVDHASEHRALLSCVVEEMTQALGLPNDADSVYPSIFNDKTPEALLTGLDVLLIQLLYHPRIKAGMTQAQVSPVLTQVLQQWQHDGHLDAAEQLARKTPFYDMMGYD